MATTNPFQFIQQVRSEVSKVTWPTRREVLLTTGMVFVMSARWPRHLRNFRADLLDKLEWVCRSHLRTLCELHCSPIALS